MIYKHKVKFLPWLMLVAVLATAGYVNLANAAVLSGALDIMSSQTVSQPSNHAIQFVTPTGVDASTDTIILTFPSDFSLTGVLITDVDLKIGTSGNCSAATFSDKTLAALPAATPGWGLVISGQALTFTAPTGAVSGEIAAGMCVKVLIGTNTTTPVGTHQITNPTAAVTAANITITGTFGDTGSFNVPIIAAGTVTVTATVDPTISFTITSTCNLPNMNATTLSACPLTSTVSTNGILGYTASVVGASGTLVRVGGGGTIAAVGTIGSPSNSSPITAASSTVQAFGVSTSDSGGVVDAATVGTCASGDASAAMSSVVSTKIYAASTAPVSGDVVTACVRAKPAALTAAGTYTETLTFTVVGNF